MAPQGKDDWNARWEAQGLKALEDLLALSARARALELEIEAQAALIRLIQSLIAPAPE